MGPVFFVVAAIVIWLLCLGGSLLALRIKGGVWMSRLEALAGGVFLGASLAHLLDESVDRLESISARMHFPVAESLMVVSFTTMLGLQIFTAKGTHAHAHAPGGDNGEGGRADEHAHASHVHVMGDGGPGNEPLLAVPQLFSEGPASSNGEQHSVESGHDEHHGHHHHHEHPRAAGSIGATLTFYVLLSIHSVIEGLALGGLDTEREVIAIFIAIVAHKPLEAFALAIILLQEGMRRSIFLLLVIAYSFVTPCGELGGRFVARTHSDVAIGILEGISAGTFFFVAVHEVSELLEHKGEMKMGERVWHFVAFASGCGWMLAVAAIEGAGGA